MNVLLDSVIYGLQKFGGISQYWNELSLRLASSNRLRLSQHMPGTLKGSFPAIHSIPSTSVDRLPVGLARYLPIMPDESPDLVHSSYYRIPVSPRLLLVTTTYDFTYEKYRSGFARSVHSMQKRTALHRSQGMVFISASTRDDAVRLYPDLAARPMAVIHLASDPLVFHPDVRPRSVLPDGLRNTPYVLFTGQRGGYKRFDLAMESIAASPDLTLVAVGPPIVGGERSRLESLLPGRWQSFTDASNDTLRLLYTHAQALVYPSDYEGFGLPILDAMACGCPVVCANRSSFPEVAGDAAIRVGDQRVDKYSQALAEAVRPAVRADLVALGRARAATFTWEATAARTLAFYGEVRASGLVG